LRSGLLPSHRARLGALSGLSGSTHYERVLCWLVADGWCHVALANCPTVLGWRRLVMDGDRQAGARQGHDTCVHLPARPLTAGLTLLGR